MLSSFRGDTVDMCAGKISFDSISEKAKTGITTRGICLAMSASWPSTNNKGAKAAMVVMTPKVTGTATSLVPYKAAFDGDIPLR